jgi:predicted SprT family Zn-dependent metalloprotease
MHESQILSEARATVLEAMQAISSDMPVPRIVCNRRLATTAGRAIITTNTIELNPRLFARIEADNRKATTLHDLAHLLARYQYRHRPITAHGSEWQATMRQLGQRPPRCQSSDCSGLRRKRTRIVHDCQC